MPRRDGTGPQGIGPGTGRGKGRCQVNKSGIQPEDRNGTAQGSGVGQERGKELQRGLGRGVERRGQGRES